ncbi:MAG: nickel-responsive transcriptional regulator NikR [Spirochaetota bacterium]|nr:nickel-responsive transcriptional regulator NikR [Spirochaetota bacterium]
MNNIIRFGVSIDEKMLQHFDNLITEKGYVNRSEAIRDLIREMLIKDEISDPEKEIMGILVLIYSHEVRELSDRLNDIQHNCYQNIVSTLHVHLDKHNCLEVLLIKGKAKIVKDIADHLISVKNVRHGKLTITTTGEHLS